MIRRLQPLPGAKKLLNSLTRFKVSWAIATTGSRAQTKQLLRMLQISRNITDVTGDDVAKAKPSPDVFIRADMLEHIEDLGTS